MAEEQDDCCDEGGDVEGEFSDGDFGLSVEDHGCDGEGIGPFGGRDNFLDSRVCCFNRCLLEA